MLVADVFNALARTNAGVAVGSEFGLVLTFKKSLLQPVPTRTKNAAIYNLFSFISIVLVSGY
jgi:hypothetical protein